MNREKIATLFNEIEHGLRIVLAANISDGIDLRDVGESSDLFQAALSRHFEALLRGEGCETGDGGAPNDALLRRIARMQADIFMLKSALAERDGASVRLEAAYRDPLALARMLAAGNAGAAGEGPTDPVSVAFDARILCGGWSAPERAADGRPIRWMAPGPRASVVLPAMGPGRHAVEAQGIAADPVWLEGLQVVCLGGAVAALSATREARGAASIRFAVDLPADYANGFMFLEWSAGGARGGLEPGAFGLTDFEIRRESAGESAGSAAAREA